MARKPGEAETHAVATAAPAGADAVASEERLAWLREPTEKGHLAAAAVSAAQETPLRRLGRSGVFR